MLPYELGTAASFAQPKFNGRALGDDVYDVMWTLAASTPIADGVAPDKSRIVPDFPYYGRPYTELEQEGLSSLQSHIG
jgi:hypothetical protein